MPSLRGGLKLAVRMAWVLVVIAAAFEATVRIDDWARFGVPLLSPEAAIGELLMQDSTGIHPRPGASFMQFHINSRGFRGTEIRDADLAARPLVIVSGASETFGLYESARHDWPSQLADSLGRRCGADRVTVLNAAFAGMMLPTAAVDFRMRLEPLHPRVFVYYPSPSQYLFPNVPRPAPTGGRTSPPPSRLRSRGLPRIRDAVKRSVPGPVMELLRRVSTERRRSSGDTPFPGVPVERLDSLEAHLRFLVGEVRRGGAEVVLITHQLRFGDTSAVVERRWMRAYEQQIPKANAEILLQFEALAAERVRRVASDSATPLVEPAMSARADLPSLFADFLHFTDRGSGVMGGAVADRVAPLVCPARRQEP